MVGQSKQFFNTTIFKKNHTMGTNRPIFNKRELNTGVMSLYWFNPLLVLPFVFRTSRTYDS